MEAAADNGYFHLHSQVTVVVGVTIVEVRFILSKSADSR